MLVPLLLASGFAAAPPLAEGWEQLEQHPQAILVQHRFSYVICAGVCTDADLMVDSSGLVLFQVRRVGGGTKSFEYRVSQDQVRKFWQLYSGIRPKRLAGPIGDCNSQGHRPIIDWDIRWQDTSAQSRLLACTGAKDVAKAWNNGFYILRISPVTGQRLNPEQAEVLRVHER